MDEEDNLTIEELEAHLASAYDEDGNDVWLAESTAKMSPETRRQSRENIARWVRKMRTAADRIDGEPSDV